MQTLLGVSCFEQVHLLGSASAFPRTGSTSSQGTRGGGGGRGHTVDRAPTAPAAWEVCYTRTAHTAQHVHCLMESRQRFREGTVPTVEA